MADKPIAEDNIRGKRVVGGAVSEADEQEVLAAFKQAGFRTKSQGVRCVLLAFSRSAKVRDAVAECVSKNLEIAA